MQVADLFAKLSLKPDKSSFSAGDRLIRGIKGALVGLGVFQGARFLKGLVEDSVALGDNLAKVSSQLNISTTALQELEFAAKQSDLEFAGLTQGLKFLTRNAFQAANGSKEMRKNFKQLGISTAELKSLKPDELLLEVAEAFETLPEGQKIPRATEIFGRQGAELVPFLSKGKKGIAELRREAERLGLIIPPEQVEAFAKADDEFNKFSFTIRKVKAALATALLPVVQKYLEKIRVWLSDGGNMKRLLERTEVVIAAVARGIEKASEAFAWFIDNWDDLRPIIMTIAGLWAMSKVAGFAGAVWGVVAAINGVAVAIGLTVASAYAAYKVLSTMNNEGTEGSVESAVNDYRTRAQRKGGWLERMLHAPSDWLADLAVQRDEDSAFGRSELNFFRSGANRGANARRANAEITAAMNEPRRALGTPVLPSSGSFQDRLASTITNHNTITVNSPNADPAMVAKEVVATFESIMRRGAAALQ